MDLLETETKSQQNETETMIGLCGVCAEGCLNTIYLADGKLERMQPIKAYSDSIICPRGAKAREVIYSPDRILYPQFGEGERGERQFNRISWDHAYDFIVAKFDEIARQFGPQALAVYTGRGNFEFGLNEHFAPSHTVESSANAVLFPYGSPNTTGVGALCFVSYGMIAPRATFGEYIRNMEEDFEESDLILVWGDNPATDSPPSNLVKIKRAQKNGARVVIIDHRLSETVRATRADWIGIRPGTDGALALGLMHLLIENNHYDHQFVENWTHGFEELREYIRLFSPEEVSKVTWIPEEKIRWLAEVIASAKALSILTYTGLEYSNSGVQAIRAVWIMQAITGHLDTPGGKLFKMPGRPRLNRLLTDPPANSPKPVGANEYPLYYSVRNEAHALMLPKAILESDPYPVRGLIISGASLLTAWPQPKIWRKALASLDILVVINRFPTADTQYADVILPATTMFEIKSYMQHGNQVYLRERVIPPLGEARNDYLIFAELAQRLGYGHLWPQTEDGMIEHALEGTGISLMDLSAHPEGMPLPIPEMRYRKYETGELRADGEPGFETPTGKFEIASEWLKQYGYEPLPVYTEPSEGPLARPDLARQFPLVFNSGARTNYDFRSQHHNIPSLVSKLPAPLVHLHNLDARTRGIQEGDEVIVKTPRGELPFTAHITEDILPGVVEVNMGGGGPLGPQAWQQANVNELTDANNVDKISGFPVYKALLCEVSLKTQEQ